MLRTFKTRPRLKALSVKVESPGETTQIDGKSKVAGFRMQRSPVGPGCQDRLQGGARFACMTLNRIWIERGNFHTKVTILKNPSMARVVERPPSRIRE